MFNQKRNANKNINININILIKSNIGFVLLTYYKIQKIQK